MKGTSKITTANNLKNIKALMKIKGQVGIFDDAKYPDGKPVYDVAVIHEYGNDNIEQRSFLRKTMLKKSKVINAELNKQYRLVLKGRSPVKGMGNVVMLFRNLVIKAFTTGGFGEWKDISDTTKKLKGSTKILIDDGVLWQSIHPKVIK